MAQGICLPMQETHVRSLVQEDPTCCGATKPQLSSLCSRAQEKHQAHVLQLLKPTHPRTLLRHKRSHCSEKPVHCNEEWVLLATTREKPSQQPRPSTARNKQKHKKVTGVRESTLDLIQDSSYCNAISILTPGIVAQICFLD